MTPFTGRRSYTPGGYKLVWRVQDACNSTVTCPFDFTVRFPEGITDCSQVVANSNAPHTMCGNGDFESGTIDPNEWCAKHGYNTVGSGGVCGYPVWPNSCSTTFSSGSIGSCFAHQTIVNKAVDPTVGILTVAPAPSFNSHSVRLGNNEVFNGQESIIKEFNVNSGNTILEFWYACVFQDGHSGYPHIQPGMEVFLSAYQSGNWIDISNLVDLGNGTNQVIADCINPFLTCVGGIAYKDWSCVTVDLSDHIGEIVRVEFRNRDCTAGAHWGYTYLDNICLGCPSVDVNLANTTCLPGDICVDYDLPTLSGITGQCRFVLEIFHGGSIIHTEISPFQTSGNNYCFTIDDCEVFFEDMYDYRIRVDCSVPAPPCPLNPPPVQNPIHLQVQYLGDDMTGVIPGLNNDIETCCINCCDSIKIVSTDICSSKISSVCEVNTIQVHIQNGVASTFDWTCAPRPNIYAFENQSQFTVTIPSGCIPDFTLNVDPVYTDPYKPIIITYDITFANGKTCTVSDTLNCPCAVIKGTAWYDQNGDGIIQPAENGLNGLSIYLIDVMTGLIFDKTETGHKPDTPSDDGYYEFPCVRPGMYYVKFDLKGDLETSSSNQGNDDTVDSDITGTYGPLTTDKITVFNGDTICNIDGGFKDKAIAAPVFTITGSVMSNNNGGLSNAWVSLLMDDKPYKHCFTDFDGKFQFDKLEATKNYYTSVEYSGKPLQGVSTLDLVLIQRHILGIQPFDHPVKYIAADVNGSNSITAGDIIEIRKLILGVTDQFQSGKNWRFAPRNLPYEADYNPFPFTEYISINNEVRQDIVQDFYAVKMGDINGNALPGSMQPRSGSTYKILLDNTPFTRGKELRIPVYASEEINMSGFQFSLNAIQNLQWKGIEGGEVTVSQDQYRIENDNLKISYSGDKNIFVNKGDKLFDLILYAKADGNLSESVSLSDQLSAELYDDEYNTIPLVLKSGTDEQQDGYQLLPAIPNPFSDETTLHFNIPKDEVITFNFYTMDGKLVLSKKEMYFKGKNMMKVKGEELRQSDTYIIKMISNEGTKIRKVIYIQ